MSGMWLYRPVSQDPTSISLGILKLVGKTKFNLWKLIDTCYRAHFKRQPNQRRRKKNEQKFQYNGEGQETKWHATEVPKAKWENTHTKHIKMALSDLIF